MTGDEVNQFQDNLLRLTASSTPDDIPRIGLAVSGGSDSIALLLLADVTIKGRFAVATVDHKLRSEAAAEALFVKQICEQRGIPHAILEPARPIAGNIQSEARKVRYALLKKWMADQNCQYIATAHHADDQLETMLMRLARGSGIDGLSGVRPVNGDIIRPLLDFEKAQLNEICRIAGITPVDDPSNHDPDYDRVRMRQFLKLADNPLDSKAAARSAAALASAAQALDWMTDTLAASRIKASVQSVELDANDLPRELQRRLLLKSIRMIDPDYIPRRNFIARLLDDLSAGKKSTIGDIVCTGGSTWKFTPAPQRHNQSRQSSTGRTDGATE